MSTILYHFCPAHAVEKIKREGITRGRLPWNLDKQGNPTFLTHISGDPRVKGPGFQWLTQNPSFDQPFCLLGTLPFPKNAFRVTVVIPRELVARLSYWPDMCKRANPDCRDAINNPAVDWQNWFVFYGRIGPVAFLEITRNAGQLLASEGAG